MAKVCFITAIYGGYEQTCKRFVPQSIPADFICFTDNPNIKSNGWIIDTMPYHITDKSPLDTDNFHNSYINNKHTFNVAKYYKQAFRNIPILKKYDVIVWLDGTVEIIYDRTAEYLLNNIKAAKVIGWHHEYRSGKLESEVVASNFSRYSSTVWNNQFQPVQDVAAQYKKYLRDGYNTNYLRTVKSHTPHLGVWITCFVAFLNNDADVADFLDLWYLQTLKYTTQDQVGFPYVCYKKQFVPFTLPNSEISGDSPHSGTQFYRKHSHGI